MYGKFVLALGPHISLAASSYARAASSAVSNVPSQILVFLHKRNVSFSTQGKEHINVLEERYRFRAVVNVQYRVANFGDPRAPVPLPNTSESLLRSGHVDEKETFL